jgi:hypothetical protein
MQCSFETLVPLRVVDAASSGGLVQGLYTPHSGLSDDAKMGPLSRWSCRRRSESRDRTVFSSTDAISTDSGIQMYLANCTLGRRLSQATAISHQSFSFRTHARYLSPAQKGVSLVQHT